MRLGIVSAAGLGLALFASAALAQPITLCHTPQGKFVPCNQQIAPVIPSGATARCKDGTFYFNHHMTDACVRHGGVAARYQ